MKLKKEAALGCLPNYTKPEIAIALEGIAAPWDASDMPKICTWESFRPFLEEKAENYKKRYATKNLPKMWWEIARMCGFEPEKLLLASQGNIGSCAGVSYFDRCYLITLLKQIAAGSEQMIEPVNALVTWLFSKGWSRWGGQTISAVVKEGCETGVFPATIVGEYSPHWNDRRKAEKGKDKAKLRQMGGCLVPGSVDPIEVIDLALKAGHVVEIGNSRAVSEGTQKDINGVATVEISGTWSHATCFSEFMEVDGKSYYRWENSHGLIYPNTRDEPRFGAWMTRDVLKRFCEASFCDVAVITYVEAPYDVTIKPTLEVL